MHDTIQERIQMSNNAIGETALPCIGLYGMGGSEKTTMCKVFCNEMMQVYLGKVCHVELGSMDVVELCKKLLKSMDNFGSAMLSSIDEAQALHLLRKHITCHKVKQGHCSFIIQVVVCLIGSLRIMREQWKCNFKVEGTDLWEYHPLALKVLGTRVGPKPDEWEEIKVDSKYYGSETKDQIFAILRSGYDDLMPQHQRMFLDLALTWRSADLRTEGYGVTWELHCLHGERENGFFPTHLKVEVEKMGLQHSPRCCFYRASGREFVIQEGRVRIESHPVSRVTKDVLKCTICSKAELLSIGGCANLESIDVPDLLNLKMLEVAGGCPQLRRIELEGAANLQYLIWLDFVGEFPNLTSLESLEGLWLQSYEEVSAPSWKGSLHLPRSSNLETLVLPRLPLRLLNLNGAVRLGELIVMNCKYLERFEGLESLVNLEHVRLEDCSSLLEFPSLVKFPRLREFILEGAAKLKEIQGFAILTCLHHLSLKGGRELKELPD